MSVFRLGQQTTVLQDFITEGNWVKGTRIPLYYFLQVYVNDHCLKIKSRLIGKDPDAGKD